jgi:hypothetical protein
MVVREGLVASSADVQDLGQALQEGLAATLGDKLYGIYVYGAVAFPESDFTGDIDFHVILTHSLTEAERRGIASLHTALARDFPPLGQELDGYYILLEDARRKSAPVHQLRPDIVDNAWALHREHILAGRCIVLHGPDPRQLYPPATWAELKSDLGQELNYVEAHLFDYPGYCILNLCRLMYSFQTRDVVISKKAAAEWAHGAFPQWRRPIEVALESYAGQAKAQDERFMLSEVSGFLQFAKQRINNY